MTIDAQVMAHSHGCRVNEQILSDLTVGAFHHTHERGKGALDQIHKTAVADKMQKQMPTITHQVKVEILKTRHA